MRHPNAKLFESEVRGIHLKREQGWTHVQLCREFQVSSTQLARILNGTQWKEIWLEFHDPAAFERLQRQGDDLLNDMPQSVVDQLDEMFLKHLSPEQRKALEEQTKKGDSDEKGN